jgi:hypothetical protein
MSGAHVALIEAIQASWSDPDPEAFVSLFAEDGLFEDKTYGIAARGHEQLGAHARRVQKHNVGLKVEILTCDATYRTGVAEWRLSRSTIVLGCGLTPCPTMIFTPSAAP